MTLNSIQTCKYHLTCKDYNYKKCLSIEYMTSCKRLNDYLIQETANSLEEDEHINGDVGLLRCLQ